MLDAMAALNKLSFMIKRKEELQKKEEILRGDFKSLDEDFFAFMKSDLGLEPKGNYHLAEIVKCAIEKSFELKKA